MNIIRQDEGAALLTVLLLVSVMSAAMVVTLDTLNLETRNVASESQLYQAREYAFAAEIIGANQALQLAGNRELLAIQDLMIPEKRVSFQIEGGEIAGELTEATNCFNLASLVKANSANGFEINQRSYDQYVRLLSGFGIGERQAMALASSLVDWQDSDDSAMSMGAESFTYSQSDIPYRTANHPINQIEELRLIKGYNPDLIEALKRISCVDPVSMETMVNVNSANVAHAPLVKALLGLPLSDTNIASIFETRPAVGFDNIARFWNSDLLRNRQIPTDIRKQFSIMPKRYLLSIDVLYGDVSLHQESLIGIGDDQSYHLIHRDTGI